MRTSTAATAATAAAARRARRGQRASSDAPKDLEAALESLLRRLRNDVGLSLPGVPLDALVEGCGAAAVAEMTGRNKVPLTIDGKTSSAKADNMDEKNAFLSGEKRIAIISEAASTGISLHAHEGVANQQQRKYIAFELPWSAEQAVQQFGRTHRSNQTSAPSSS